MTFNNLDRADAERIKLVLEQLEASLFQEARDAQDAEDVIALVWWDTVKPNVIVTRQDAKDVFDFIKNLLTTETDVPRLRILRGKLKEANEKLKDLKINV